MYYEKVCVRDTDDEPYQQEQCGHGPIAKITSVKERESPGGGSGVMLFASIMITLIFFPISFLFILKIIPQFKRVLIFRNGRLHRNKAYGPGIVFYLPCIDELKHVDLRIRGIPVPAQEIITKDALPAVADAAIFYKITNPMYAVMNIGNYNLAVEQTASFTLKSQVAAKDLVDLLKNRCAVSQEIYECMKVLTKMWGIRIIRTEIKEVRMPLQLQKTMAAEAESTRLTTARVAMAQAEIDISKNLRRATCILQQNPMGMQLRYLQSLYMISGEKSHTVVLPASCDVWKAMNCHCDC